MGDDVQARLVAVEEKIAYLEQTVDDLSEMIVALQRKIEPMRKELRDLRDVAWPDADDAPPHWGRTGPT